ncbi:MAG: hypothetical protein U5M51_11715 [Emticicia sp.]|nr:hypothetical protein [Emticicia sp.]
MKNKPTSPTQKAGYHVVDDKLRAANSYLKTIDMNKLHETIRQAQKEK